jgi:uncharacterized membrane protein YiaA
MDGAVPIVNKKGAKMKNNPEDMPMVYLLYVVLGILALVAGAVIYIVRMFSAFQSLSIHGR